MCFGFLICPYCFSCTPYLSSFSSFFLLVPPLFFLFLCFFFSLKEPSEPTGLRPRRERRTNILHACSARRRNKRGWSRDFAFANLDRNVRFSTFLRHRQQGPPTLHGCVGPPTLDRSSPSDASQPPAQPRRSLPSVVSVRRWTSTSTPAWCRWRAVDHRGAADHLRQLPGDGHRRWELPDPGRARKCWWSRARQTPDRSGLQQTPQRSHASPTLQPGRKLHDGGHMVQGTATSAEARGRRGRWRRRSSKTQMRGVSIRVRGLDGIAEKSTPPPAPP